MARRERSACFKFVIQIRAHHDNQSSKEASEASPSLWSLTMFHLILAFRDDWGHGTHERVLASLLSGLVTSDDGVLREMSGSIKIGRGSVERRALQTRDVSRDGQYLGKSPR